MFLKGECGRTTSGMSNTKPRRIKYLVRRVYFRNLQITRVEIENCPPPFAIRLFRIIPLTPHSPSVAINQSLSVLSGETTLTYFTPSFETFTYGTSSCKVFLPYR